MIWPISSIYAKGLDFFPKKKDTLTLDQMSSALSHQQKARNYRGRKVLLPKKKGNYWKLRATIDDFPIELSIPHNPLGILHQKESIFLFEKAANLCTKIIFFLPRHIWLTAIGKAHKKKISKTSKSQRGFFSHAARVRKEKIGIQGQKVTTEWFKIIHRNTNFVGLRVGISSSKSMAIIEAHKAKSPTATLWGSTKIDSKRFRNGV